MLKHGLLLIACASAPHAQTVTELYNFPLSGGKLLLGGKKAPLKGTFTPQ